MTGPGTFTCALRMTGQWAEVGRKAKATFVPIVSRQEISTTSSKTKERGKDGEEPNIMLDWHPQLDPFLRQLLECHYLRAVSENPFTRPLDQWTTVYLSGTRALHMELVTTEMTKPLATCLRVVKAIAMHRDYDRIDKTGCG